MSFSRDGNKFTIPISPDEDGFVGRQCPVKDCGGYFKIELGTGLKGESLPCYCPYCGYQGSSSEFRTKEQIEYAKSVVLREVSQDILKMMKKMERRPDPRAFISLGIKVDGRPFPIHYYREKKLEQHVICENCTLRYAIYGVFGYCPDCSIHNSLQILYMNLDIVLKMLSLASETIDGGIALKLVENSLEDVVSSFDGFGRELVKTFAAKALEPAKVSSISFQNIASAQEKIKEQFSIDIAAKLEKPLWDSLTRSFQKRHLISHKMGVIDQEYINRSGDCNATLRRKITLDKIEVQELVTSLRIIGRHLFAEISAQSSAANPS